MFLTSNKTEEIIKAKCMLSYSSPLIRGDTLSAHSDRPWKIPEWIVLVRENISVNKGPEIKKLKLYSDGFVCFIFLSRLSSKKVENNSI